MTLKVGLIGCGAIGTSLANLIDEGKAGNVKLLAIYDKNLEKAHHLATKLHSKPKVVETFDDLLSLSQISLIVEAASQEAVKQYASKILQSNKNLMIMSVGALVDTELYEMIKHEAEKYGRKIYIPSGAIAGLDGVKAAFIGGVKKVVLTTRKPPKALRGAPYIEDKKIDLDAIKDSTLIYKGTASEACRFFPANINVAATLSLAGIGAEKTEVEIIADPKINRNIHEVRVMGSFGELIVQTRNLPSPMNPKTSYLAVLSAIATLKKISENISIGT